jgi:hypothetical protein
MPGYLFLLFIALTSCNYNAPQQASRIIIENTATDNNNPYASVAAIPLPPGFTRVHADSSSFTGWLRRLPLKKNKTVYLYNGILKRNQAAQFAVVDISVGDKDLQQCADAVIRLRAEYLYARKTVAAIDFTDNNLTHYRLPAGANRNTFNKYLEKVFSYCGTASLEKQLVSVNDFNSVAAGDVLIKGGSPGHAMQVIDVAQSATGKRIYLLAQSYMPAQDIHVVVNPANGKISPWYEINTAPLIETPEWIFKKENLKKWPDTY